MKQISISLAIILVFSSFVVAEEISLSRDQRKTEIRLVQDNFVSRTDSNLILECHIQSMNTWEIKNSYGNFTLLDIAGWQHTYHVGEPRLPMLSRLLEVPLGGKLSVHVLSSTQEENELKSYNINYPLYPTQPSQRKDKERVAFAYNKEAYNTSYARESIVEIEDLGIMRSSRLALIHFKPIQYSPVDGKIKIANDIKVEVKIANADMGRTMEMKRNYASPYLGFVAEKAITPSSLKYETSERAPQKYLIISDPMFRNNAKLNEFVAWKQELGFTVSLVFTDQITGGATNTAIRDFIKKEYNTPSDGVPPLFLLLIGDNEQIPGAVKQAPSRGDSHYTDLDYSAVTDGDYLPDILCGRFSAKNAGDLEPQINKTISYGKKQFSDPNFLKRYALVAGWDGNWAVKRGYPQIRYAIEQYFRLPAYVQDITDNSSPDQNTFLSSKSEDNTSKIVDLVSKGVCFFNYTAHGDETSFADPSFSISNIDGLKNTGMYPLVVGNCCLTASYQVDTCFGEKWLRVADKGAIGYIGGSNYTYWDEDLWFGVGYLAITPAIDSGNAPESASDTKYGMYDQAFNKGDLVLPQAYDKRCNAGVMWAGNLAVTEAPNSTLKEYYWQVYHLFGDPSLEPYWANLDQTPPPVYPAKEFEKTIQPPVNIPDNNQTGVESTLTVAESLTPVNFDVYLDITHTYIGDLTVTLTHKTTGKSFVVREKTGGGNDNIQGWQGKTTAFNDIDIKGDWVLCVKDTASSDTGTLNGWKIKVYYEEK